MHLILRTSVSFHLPHFYPFLNLLPSSSSSLLFPTAFAFSGSHVDSFFPWLIVIKRRLGLFYTARDSTRNTCHCEQARESNEQLRNSQQSPPPKGRRPHLPLLATKYSPRRPQWLATLRSTMATPCAGRVVHPPTTTNLRENNMQKAKQHSFTLIHQPRQTLLHSPKWTRMSYRSRRKAKIYTRISPHTRLRS